MSKLPKRLIKKYGISKKAWTVFKREKGGKTTTTRKIKPNKTRSYTMAKKRRSGRKSSKKASKGFVEKMVSRIARPATAVLYGYTRDKISDAIANSAIGKNLPVTRFTDEATMIALAFGARQMGLAGNKYGRLAIQSIEAIEWASVGQEISDIQQENKASRGTTAIAASNSWSF